MRDGRQEEMWKYVSQMCFINALFQSADPRKVKRKDFNDWEQIQDALNKKNKPSSEQLNQIAQLFRH